MHLQWNGNDYLTHFKCLVGRCSTNTVDRPAAWVCYFLTIRALCCVRGFLQLIIAESLKAVQQGIWKRVLSLPKMSTSIYVC
jgi:hypothetical protein